MEKDELYKHFKPPFRYDSEGQKVFDSEGNMVADIRGWGYLTGRGGLDLSPDIAEKVQDEMGLRVAMLLTENANTLTK